MTKQSERLSCNPLLRTIPEAAAQLNVGRSTIYELIRSEQLEIVKLGRCARIPNGSIEMLIETLRDRSRPNKSTG
jgi:excisionase family DNA binding protein